MTTNKNSAYGPALGYIVQYFYVFYYLIQAEKCIVEFETQDDIYVTFPNSKKRIWVQSKWSTSKSHSILQDSSDDLWKTLANWLTNWQSSDESVEFHYLGVNGKKKVGVNLNKFSLYSGDDTQVKPSELAIEYLNKCKSKKGDTSAIKLKALELITEQSDKFDSIILNFKVITVERNYLEEIRNRLKEVSYGDFILSSASTDEQLLELFANTILTECTILLNNNQGFSISSEKFITPILKRLSGSKTNLLWQALHHDHKSIGNPVFLQQINYLFADDEDLENIKSVAINSYLDAQYNTTQWQTSGGFTPIENQKYLAEIRKDFTHTRILYANNGQQTYGACMLKTIEPRGCDLGESKYFLSLTQGAYQRLANNEDSAELYIKWDSSFKEGSNNENS
tara:strand:+ start:9152 stop:10339 length:1188 start_codon:yes stop_codon:yes gene_type:complete